MITVAIADALESSQQALRFIYEQTTQKGLRVQSISPEQTTLYTGHRRLRLKQYLRALAQENKCDLLIVHLTKEAVKRQLYQHFNFNIMILFDNRIINSKSRIRQLQVTQRLVDTVHSHYYILPHRYKTLKPNTITYGWSKKAHISATSAYETLTGETEIQCCISKDIITMQGDTIPLKEFGVESSMDDIDGVLAAVATLMISGVHVENEDKV